jgi:predicted dehydrogenase/nucleoside-diphosphate-sugar epimerase
VTAGARDPGEGREGARDRVFRVGLIGAGYVSRYHVMALGRLTGVRLAGICDVDAARAEAAAREARTTAFTAPAQLLRAGVDVVHVLTPPATHAGLAIQALEHGCHVLVEKPLAISVEECDRIAAAAARAGRWVAVHHSLLRDHFVVRALSVVRGGALGDVTGVDYFRSSDYPPSTGGSPPPHHGEGGYPWRDLGVHALYLVREFLGEIEGVEADFADSGAMGEGGRRAKREPGLLYDEWRALVRCARGRGHVHLSWNVEPLQHVLVVHGTRGTLRADMFAMAVTTRTATPWPKVVERPLHALGEAGQVWAQVPLNALRFLRGRLLPYHGLQMLVAEVYERLAAGAPGPPVSVADARPIVEWTERIAREADRAKEGFLARFPRTLSATVAVTGATGCIGRRLLARLLAEGQRVRVLVRRAPPPEIMGEPRVEVVYGDLGDPEAVDRLVAGAEIVYHLGATMRGSPGDFARGTVAGTRNVVESVLRHRVARLVYVSSLGVLHAAVARPGTIAREEWPLEPRPARRGAYAQSKLQAEQVVRDAVARRHLPAVILRPGQVVGGDAPLLTPAVARRVGGALVVLGDGSLALPLVHVEDVVDAILAAARSTAFDGSVFHIVDAERVSQNDVARVAAGAARIVHVPRGVAYALALGVEGVAALAGRSAPLSRYRLRSALAPMAYDCTAARERLGWQPRLGVRQALVGSTARG